MIIIRLWWCMVMMRGKKIEDEDKGNGKEDEEKSE